MGEGAPVGSHAGGDTPVTQGVGSLDAASDVVGAPSPLRRMLLRIVPALLVLTLAGCSGLRGTLDEASELFAEGGERVLKDPMRPARSGGRVLVIALDGVGEGRLSAALAAGDMPRLSAFLGADRGDGVFDHAYQARSVVSVFPSETAAGWAAVYTGTPPAESGVTGNEWYDRDSLATFAPVPLSVGTIEQTLSIWTDSLFSQVLVTPTLFERADRRSFVALGFVYRGADVLMPPDLNDVGDLVEGAVSAVFGGRDEIYEELDDDAVEGVRRGLEKYGAPDLQIAYFPGVDLVAHAAGEEAQRAYLREETDPDIGAILDAYQELGVLDETTVVIVSDHGHGDVLADDRHSLDTGGRDEPPALLDSLGYRLRDFSIDPDSSDANVVMIYDEAVAMVYLANGTTCAEGQPCDWTVAPRLREDVLPLARAFRAASDADTSGVGGLSGTLDLIFARASDPTGRTSPPYRVFHEGRLIPVADYLRQAGRTDLAALDQRLTWLTDGPLGHRAGDILLLARSGEDVPIEERFYFGAPRHSAHGGASPGQSHISLIVAQPNGDGRALRDVMRAAVGDAPTQLDVTPLILHLLR